VPEGGDDASQPYLLADAYAARPLPFTRKVRSSTAHDKLGSCMHAKKQQLLQASLNGQS
jgi:hypothetical protein